MIPIRFTDLLPLDFVDIFRAPVASWMANNLLWLRTCKSAQLKAIATAIGINSSGTKSLLTSHLLQHLPQGYLNDDDKIRDGPAKQHDIISIDMGIRNLAYCRLTFPKTPKPSWNGDPIINEWARIEISKIANQSQDLEETKTKEAFDPETYSQHAYNLVSSFLSSTPTQPTHILIERQRFRSMGGSAVQEWTLRVNMFEAMIYAVLKTLAAQGAWQGTVHPIAPAKVSKFWLGDREGADEVEGKGSKSAKTKTAKIQLVGRWLEERRAGSTRFELEGKAEETGRAYSGKRRGGGAKGRHVDGSSKAFTAPQIGKLDDLADCLLQGMAWIKWEQNRRLIMAKGINALDEMD